MSDYPVTRGSRPGDPHPTLRLAALTAVIAGVVLVAAAAFLLSYEGIHQIALQAGVSPTLARLYPLMFDAMLIVACAATLALRSAGWGSRLYVWACLLLVLAAVAAGDALHATGVHLNGQPARAAIAIIPWVLLLMGFGIWLVMLRHWRRARAAGTATGTAAATGTGAASRAGAATGTAAATGAGAASRAGAATGTETGRAGLAVAGSAAVAGGAVTWAAGRGATPAHAGDPRSGIDELMEPRAGQAPKRATAADSPAAGKPDAGQEQRRDAAPDQKLPAPAGAGGKAEAAAAGPPAGTGRNGAATTATGIGPAAAVAAGAAGAAGPAAARTAGSASTGTDESSQGGTGKDATGKDATGEDAASKDSADKDVTSKGNGSKDNGGKGDAEARDRRTRLGGFREMPVSADDEEGSVKILPPKPKATAQGAAPAKDDTAPLKDGAATAKDGAATAKDGAAPGKDSQADETGTLDGDADRAAPTSPPLPAAALAPQFDRLRSSPTPPEDPGDRG